MEPLHILVTLLIAVAGFLIGRRIGIPVPAMIGSMLAVGIFSAFTGFALMPTPIKMFSQGISGAFIGMSVTRRDVRNKIYLFWFYQHIRAFIALFLHDKPRVLRF